MMDRNHELKQELEALQGHCELLSGQNLELQQELDGFVQTDDIVRKNLDRKERVSTLRHNVDDALRRSEAEVLARSPMKRSGGFA